jgi:putative aldouronate transport system permease protein
MMADHDQALHASRIGNVPKTAIRGKPKRATALANGWRRWWPFYVMMAPGLMFFLVMHYLPIWEARIAFEQVRIVPPNIWVGLKHFYVLFASPVFWQVLANTLIISAMKMAFFLPVPILVALLINEVRGGRLRKFIQSAIYLPHFLSWVVIAGVFIAALSPTDGAVNNLMGMAGIAPRSFANRWQKIWHVTLPGIVPTIATLFILNAGMFLNADLNQVINFSNDVVRSKIDIVDTYVYRIGLQTGEYSLATAAGLFKAVLGTMMIVTAHFVSKRLTGKGVW